MPFVTIVSLFILDALMMVFFQRRSSSNGSFKRVALIGVLFFFSGFPALIYQIVWQRALFLIYGVNVESVAVVVAAFMLGLGLGSLVGGQLSVLFPQHAIILFGIAELGIAVFGLESLALFHWVAKYTAGASLGHTVVFSLLLLLLPTMLMGATLPLLVTHLVRTSKDVGHSVGTLYFVNTLGSAVACYFAAILLMRSFGQTGSVSLAACINTLVGASAFLYGRLQRSEEPVAPVLRDTAAPVSPMPLSMTWATMVVAIAGFVSLGFEILWYRVFSLATGGRAPAFALLLATFLAGIAAGAFVVERALKDATPGTVRNVLGMLLITGGTFGYLCSPLAAFAMSHEIELVSVAPAFYLAAGLIGAVFPLVCRLALPPDAQVGRGVSLLYLSNIAGSTIGSLIVGFVLMNFVSMRGVSLLLGGFAALTGIAIQLSGEKKEGLRNYYLTAPAACAVLAFAFAPMLYRGFYEKLIFGEDASRLPPFTHVVENRSGVISVTDDGTVYGGGVYDGMFNVDPVVNSNFIIRAYAISAFHSAPKRVLMIGLASGSWAQVIAQNPEVEALDVVEINPGYLQIIPKYPQVASLLQNPKVKVIIDDGRRWMMAHPTERYDLIVMNTTFNWRDHASALLSTDFLALAHDHLNKDGVLFYNTTDAPEVYVTAFKVFPYALRVMNFLAVSDRPLVLNKEHWEKVLLQYRIDGRPMFNPEDAGQQRTLSAYFMAADNANRPDGRNMMFERELSLAISIPRARVITDDNMGTEWSTALHNPGQYKTFRHGHN
jgi:spermidine synthase